MDFPTVKKQFASTQSFNGYNGEDFEQMEIVIIAVITITKKCLFFNVEIVIVNSNPFVSDILTEMRIFRKCAY